jgi:diaminopimelate decarboxylase
MSHFKTNFLTRQEAEQLAAKHGTPLFVYSREVLTRQAKTILNVPAPYGLTVRYAMKANPHQEILKILRSQGIKIDASSGYEAELALQAGFQPDDILITSQQLPENLKKLVNKGVQFNATSLHQLEEYGKAAPNNSVSIRLNPGIGSGHSTKTTTGGLGSSFGIWYEYIPRIHKITKQYGLTVGRLHTHIGSGTDSDVWQAAARTTLEHVKEFSDVTIVDLGGGFKVGRMDDEQGTDVPKIGQAIAKELEKFYQSTGRKLRLELEPGTFLVANAGILLSKVEDIVDTGRKGYSFLKLNTGMNDILRPSLYGAQHPIAMLNDTKATKEYVIVGHNCESGDLLTPAPGEPEVLAQRRLNKAEIGDIVLIGGAGAYCASMAAHGYNSYPATKEVVI